MSAGDGAMAFVPNPMPVELALGQEEIRLLSNADYALGRLAGSAGRLVNPYLIGQPLLRREAILSSRIEGTFTTPEQLVLLEAGVASASQDARVAADTHEVLNYVRAMERGLELLKTIPVSLRLLREIHRVLLDGVRGGEDRPGEFRTVQNDSPSGVPAGSSGRGRLCADLAQIGEKYRGAKPLKGLGSGVLEVIPDHRRDTYRAVYTVRFADRVYVLHVFQKKSKKGIATPQSDIELVRERLKRAIELDEKREH